jgi:hypothetical protein
MVELERLYFKEQLQYPVLTDSPKPALEAISINQPPSLLWWLIFILYFFSNFTELNSI